jgi:hypothetical protein
MAIFNYKIKVKTWKDEATGAWLMYSKKLDISSYGMTKKKARIMFDCILSDIILSTKTDTKHLKVSK